MKITLLERQLVHPSVATSPLADVPSLALQDGQLSSFLCRAQSSAAVGPYAPKDLVLSWWPCTKASSTSEAEIQKYMQELCTLTRARCAALLCRHR